jgi:hypothetical protein
MRLAHDDRFDGRSPRVRSSKFGARRLRFPGAAWGTATGKIKITNGPSTENASIGYATGPVANPLGSLTSPQKYEKNEIWGPSLQSHPILLNY